MTSHNDNHPHDASKINLVSRQSIPSDDDSADHFNKRAHLELLTLQRRYRVLEDERYGVARDGGYTARKQLWMVRLLKAEKDDISSNLTNAVCPLYHRRAKIAEATILEFIARYQEYKFKIQKNIKQIKEMSEQGDKIQKRVVQQRLKIIAHYGLQLSRSEAEKIIKIRENKLYHVTTKFDEKCTENVNLRNEITFYLLARTRFHKRHNYLKREVIKVKNQKLQLVQHAAIIYDNRDEAVSKTKAIRERDSKESKQHVMEVKEYQRMLHHDKKIHDFLHVKNHVRDLFEGDEERRSRKKAQKEVEVDDTLRQYRHYVHKILKMTSSKSVDKLCEQYEQMEQTNLTLFKFITEVNHECETLKEAIVTLKAEIESTHNLISLRKHDQHQQLKLIQNAVVAEEEQVNKLDGIADSNLTKLGQLVHAIGGYLTLANCSNEGLLGILGNQNGVTQVNVELSISILDHRVTELQYMKRTLENRKAVEIDGHKNPKQKSIISIGRTVVNYGGPFKAEVNVQTHLGGDSNEDDSDKTLSERPYYFDEMRDFVIYQMVDAGLIDISRVPSSILDTISATSSHHDSKATLDHVEHMSLVEKVTAKKHARTSVQKVTQTTPETESYQ